MAVAVGIGVFFAMNTLVAVATAYIMECGLVKSPIAAVTILVNTRGRAAAASFAASKIVFLVSGVIVCSGVKWHGYL